MAAGAVVERPDLEARRVTYRIVAEPCRECPWKGRYDLHPGRLRNLMDECRDGDAVFVCHMTMRSCDAVETLDEDGEVIDVVYPVAGPGSAAVCAGWLEAMRSQSWRPDALQVVERLDAHPDFPAMIERVPAP